MVGYDGNAKPGGRHTGHHGILLGLVGNLRLGTDRTKHGIHRRPQPAAFRKVDIWVGERLGQRHAFLLCQRVTRWDHHHKGRPLKRQALKHGRVAGVADERHVQPFLGHGLQKVPAKTAFGVQLKPHALLAGLGQKTVHQFRHGLGRQLADAAQQHQPAAGAQFLQRTGTFVQLLQRFRHRLQK